MTAVTPAAVGTRPRRILHVDDTPATRYLVGIALRQAGFVVDEAATGHEALRLAVADCPDLVVLDVRLPDLDGLEVCRRLKATPATARTPVLLLSASFTDGVDKAHGLDRGADAYLTQPVEGPELVATVRALLRAHDAETELRLLTETIPQLVWTALPDGAFDSVNAHWLEYTGTSLADARRAGWEGAVHPEDREAVVAQWRDAVRAGAPFEAEFRLRRADGSWRWHLGRAVPMRDRDGTTLKWVGTGTDVDAARRAADELKVAMASAERARAAADEANRAKSQFLAMMSHELRTPLNAIGGYAQLMHEEIAGPLTDTQRDYLRRMGEANTLLSALINDVLNMAKLESGRVSLDLSAVRVAEVCARLDGMVTPQVAARRIAYGCRLADPSVAVYADAEKLLQILINLATNALKFTEPGGTIAVEVDAPVDDGGAADAPPRRVVRMRVRDTGRGIRPEKLAAIFEPFVQLDRKHGGSSEGVGLGLAISRDLARAMGGDLTAESVPGAGATFTLTLVEADAGDAIDAIDDAIDDARDEGSDHDLRDDADVPPAWPTTTRRAAHDDSRDHSRDHSASTRV